MSIILSTESFEYNGATVRVRAKDNWISLTDLWKASGSVKSQQPKLWLRHDDTQSLIDELVKGSPGLPLTETGSESDVQAGGSNPVYEVRRGKGGGTFATRELALEYASYLSVEIRAWLLRVGIERIEETANPDLAYTRGRDRAVIGWQEEGLDTKQIFERMDSLDDEIRENYEEVEDRRLPGDDMYLPLGIN